MGVTIPSTRLYLLLGLAFLGSLVFVWSKRFHTRLSFEEQPIIGLTVTFASVIFSLLLAFTISDFNQRYYDIRDLIADEVSKLQLTFELLKNQPGSRPVIVQLRDYVKSIIQVEWPALAQGKSYNVTVDDHRKLNTALIAWSRQYPQQPLAQGLSDYLTTSLRARRIQASSGNRFLMIIVLLAAILTLVGFWYVHIDRLSVQILVDFGIIAVIVISLYVLWIMNNPFAAHEVTLKPTGYELLLAEIDAYLATN